jgi:hypothetical protein
MGSDQTADGSRHHGVEIHPCQSRMYLLLPSHGRDISEQIFFNYYLALPVLPGESG